MTHRYIYDVGKVDLHYIRLHIRKCHLHSAYTWENLT